MTARRRQLSTLRYSQAARERLAEAVAAARTAAGMRSQKRLAIAAGVSLRVITALEGAEPGVGQSTLYAVAGVLPGWTEDTPRTVLDGGPIPEIPAKEKGPELRDDNERKLWELDLPDDVKMGYVVQYRLRLQADGTGE